MAEEKEETRSAIHIYVKDWPPVLEFEGQWSYLDLLSVLSYGAEWVRCQLIDKTVQKSLGYTQQMQEVLAQVAGKENESSQE